MAKRSYLSGYKDKDRKGMTVYMPDVTRASMDTSDAAVGRRQLLSQLLDIPSLDALYGRYKKDDNFEGTLEEYPAEMARRKEVAEERMRDPAFRRMLKLKAIKARKEKGYDIEQLQRNMEDPSYAAEDDEYEAVRLVTAIAKARTPAIKLERMIKELEAELAEEKSMETSFDKRTRQLYSPLRVQDMEADLNLLRNNLANINKVVDELKTEWAYFMDTRPKKEKGRDAMHYNKPGQTTTSKPDKVILIKKDKTNAETQ